MAQGYSKTGAIKVQIMSSEEEVAAATEAAKNLWWMISYDMPVVSTSEECV